MVGTGTTILLNQNGEGYYYNMVTPLTDISYNCTTLVAGGFAVIKSKSITTKPVVTNGDGGTATMISGSIWVANTDMYIYVYTLDGINLFYYWTDDETSFQLVSEGTDIKSTGEIGGTKVLTEDGLGGAAWQEPSGGADVQEYKLHLIIDVSSGDRWHMRQGSAGSMYNELSFSTNYQYLTGASMVNATAAILKQTWAEGIARANQTVVSFDISIGQMASLVKRLSIFRVQFTDLNQSTLGLVELLYESTADIVFSTDARGRQYLHLDAADFAATAITKDDHIYMAFGCAYSTTEVEDIYYNLICSID